MIKVIVSVKDTIAEVFNDPRVEINTASAIRAFTASVKESPHKDDFALYQVGTFNTDNGDIVKNDPVRIFTGQDVKVADSITPEQQLADLEMFKKQSGA